MTGSASILNLNKKMEQKDYFKKVFSWYILSMNEKKIPIEHFVESIDQFCINCGMRIATTDEAYDLYKEMNGQKIANIVNKGW